MKAELHVGEAHPASGPHQGGDGELAAASSLPPFDCVPRRGAGRSCAGGDTFVLERHTIELVHHRRTHPLYLFLPITVVVSVDLLNIDYVSDKCTVFKNKLQNLSYINKSPHF